METLIVQLKNKNEAERIKGILGVMKTKFQILEEMEDEIFTKMIAEGDKGDYLTDTEQADFIQNLGK